MMKICDLLTSGGRVVLVGLLAAVLAQTSTMAMEADSGTAQSGQQRSEVKQEPNKDKQGVTGEGDCNKDRTKDNQLGGPGEGREQGCKSRPPMPGDKSYTGTACTSGMPCTSVGASCSITGMHCRNKDMGGGNCLCECK